jgi:hypothetical protein
LALTRRIHLPFELASSSKHRGERKLKAVRIYDVVVIGKRRAGETGNNYQSQQRRERPSDRSCTELFTHH